MITKYAMGRRWEVEEKEEECYGCGYYYPVTDLTVWAHDREGSKILLCRTCGKEWDAKEDEMYEKHCA